MISRQNYEIVFIDYFDGKLNKKDQELLFAFLRENPDLMEEFNSFSPVKTEPDLSINYSDKERLKKDTITLFNYKTWLIGFLENDISVSQRKEVELFLSKNPFLKSELEQFKNTKSVADHRIIFDLKNKLRKQPKVIIFSPAIKRALTAAAVLFLALIAYYLLHDVKTRGSMITQHPPAVRKEIIKNEQANNVIANHKSSSDIKINKKVKRESIKKVIETPAEPQNNYFAIADPETQQEENACDDYHPPVQNNNVQQLPLAAGNLKSNSSLAGLTLEQMQATGINLSEVFDKNDIKQLEHLEKKDIVKEKNDTKTLLDVAVNKIQQISKASDIIFEKKDNSEGTAVTYAFQAGTIFSISHTAEK